MSPRLGSIELAVALGEHSPTDEQRAVIESRAGAALVVAGAGSGKTTTMAHRVVHLVANGDARPEEILGLTFTRKAARELRSRISGLLDRLPEELRPRSPETGAFDLASGPTVSTYNAFGSAVYREHALLIGREPDAEVLSEAAAWQIARRVVLESDVQGLAGLDRAVGGVVDAVLSLAHELSDNAVGSTADVLAYVEELLLRRAATVLPLGDRWERNEVVAALDRVGGLRVLLPIVDAYQEAKRRRGVMEFSDQVSSALAIARTSETAVDGLRDRYRHVILDEYQDTSVVQTRLLATLFERRAGEEGRTIVAVGDPNQSIYGWRGASDANLADFARDFGAAPAQEPFQLSTSWRNPPRVLAAANAIAEPLRAKSRIRVDPLALRPDPPSGRFEVAIAEVIDDEASRAAEWLAARLAEPVVEGGVARAPTLAVLFRKRRHIPRFAAALETAGVPHRVLGVGGLLETPEATDIVAALRVLVDPDAGSALIRLLAGARWRIGVRDLAALERIAGVVHRQRHGGRGGDGRSIVDGLDALVDAGDDWDALRAFTPEGLQRLRAAGSTLRDLRRRVGIPLPELVRVVEEALLLDVEVVANDANARGAANLREFRQQVETFVRIDDSGSPASFLAWVDRAIASDERVGPVDAPKEPGVVQLLTVHAAKGLEWESVVVPRLVEADFPDAPKEGAGWVSFGALPYEFRGDADVLREQAWWHWEGARTRKELKERLDEFRTALRTRHEDEERRLAYVAVTRSRRDLLLTGSFWPGKYDGSSKASVSRPLSRYLAEDLLGAGLLPDDLPLVSALVADPTDPHHGDVVWPLDPLGPRRPRVERAAALVRDALRGGGAAGEVPFARDLELLLAERERALRPVPLAIPQRVAASGFKEWVRDPEAVARRTRRPMPLQPHRATRLGTLFHAWVEQRYRAAAPEALFDLDDDAADLDEERTGLVPPDATALAGLKAAFERSAWAFEEPIAVERAIELPFAGRTIPCKIDAVFARDGRIEIVDWKTGRRPTDPMELAMFDYQLDLYRLAWSRQSATPLEQIDARAYFVAADEVYAPASRRGEAELLAEWQTALGALGVDGRQKARGAVD